MALIVSLQCVEYLTGKYDRVVRLSFRGKTFQSNIVTSAKRVAYFGQTFQWPVARNIDPEETLSLQLFNFSKYLNNKLVGSFVLLLQQVIQEGELKLNENLVDHNNRVIEASVSFLVRYHSPDGRIGNWSSTSDLAFPVSDNIPINNDGFDNEPFVEPMDYEGLDPYENVSRLDDMPPNGEDTASQNMIMESLFSGKRVRPDILDHEMHKPKDFQVTVTIIEGQQLAGLDIDPVIMIKLGEEYRYTSIRQSSNCPYYNEYFVFNFRETPAMIFDKIINISAFHAYGIPGRKLLRAGNFVAAKRLIGSFKCDIGMVYSAPDHQFYHKWAVLLDPNDVEAGPKGYVKCDIIVAGRGQTVKPPKSVKDAETDNIEGNLLLPVGVSKNRQRAVYSVCIYRAEDLPQTDVGILASVQKAFTNKGVAFIDAFVQVSFVGLIGKTTVKKSYYPEWNEVLRFADMFPPLCNRIKVQLVDEDAVSNETVATHFIELSQIMDPGSEDGEGMLPTYGPSWIYLYGAPRNFKILPGDDNLNEGIGEGTAYRGRLLISINTAFEPGSVTGPSAVYRDKLQSGRLGDLPRKSFILFATIFEASMIDRELKDKQIYFEISLGSYGNTLDGKGAKTLFEGNEKNANDDDDDDDDDDGQRKGLLKQRKQEEAKLPCHSITQPMMMKMMDKTYGYLPINEEKPCLFVVGNFEDFRKRLLHSNLLSAIASKLSEGLDDVREMVKNKHNEAHRRLKGTIQEFLSDCAKYLRHADALRSGVGAGRTKLDRHLRKASLDFIKKATRSAEAIRRTTFSHNVMTKYMETRDICRRLEHFAREPQHSMPDVLLWMICDKQRVAYYRFPAKDLFHSGDKDLIGKHCGKTQTIFLKKPGKKLFGQSGWIVQAKLNVQLWLGEYTPQKTLREYMENLPRGFEPIHEDENTEKPPVGLIYQDTYLFQLRAYIFQARSLIGSDSSGLSDPFARVIINNHCRTTQIIEETLCPTWDESLVIDNILVYGLKQDLLSYPPLVIVEIYDYDKVGQPEFLGRVIASPKVTLEDEEYREAELDWWDIYRGSCRAGQLLASFELLEGNEMDLPPLPPVKKSFPSREPVMSLPPGIKPAMKDFRLEVIFRGVRELPRVQLLSVDHPRIAVECAGRILLSIPIADIEKNSNFEKQVDFIDVELPENENFWPPLIVRCIDSRTFGRNILVGSCTIDYVQEFVWKPFIDNVQRPNYDSGSPAVLDIGQGNGGVSVNETTQGVSYHPGTAVPNTVTNENGPVSLTGVEVQVVRPGAKDPGTVVSGGKGAGPGGKGPGSTAGGIKKASGKPVEEAMSGNKYRELITDLDWWSKYYITKQEAALVAHEANKGSSRVIIEEEPDYQMQMLDFSSLDMSKLDKEIAEARERQKAIESAQEPKKRKKKKTAKAHVKKIKGVINQAFVRESADDEMDDGSRALKDRDGENDDDSHITRIQYYPVELENVPEFLGFKKLFQTFKLYRGKKVDDEEEDSNRLSGLFKGNFCIYKIAQDQVTNSDAPADRAVREEKDISRLKLMRGLPNHHPVDVRVIVYIVRCIDLHPVDFNGMADPYIVLHCGKQKIVDKDHRINNHLNPVFGRSFELDVTFPMESLLKIEIWDYDTLSADDLIGETMIDLEDRYFAPCQARCGIQNKYEIFGYNVWRNPLKPSQILQGLCTEISIDPPKYNDHENSIVVGGVTFVGDESEPPYVENELGERKLLIPNEHLALKVLHNWQTVPGGCPLVPEHVETRTLFCDERPGVEQGKLEMWIDMFPRDSPMPTNVVDITPRLPKSYELRCIIWNTDEVTLDDTNVLTGEQSSDIFVKGYLKGVGEDDQQTDVHYRSLTGEGNFNWRFIFRFDYLKAEDKIIFKKSMMLGMSEVEFKTPPNLTIQVWDADLVSADDFLGSITLNLNKLVKPAKDGKKCSLKMVEKQGKVVPTLNLFKNKRCKGWWPVVAREKEEGGEDDKTEKLILKGKVEAELHLLTVEEADKNPVGVAREDPEKLPDPKRPDSSFLWIFNPLKSIRYILWKNYKWYIITFIVILALVLLVAVFVYHLPNYLARYVFYKNG